MILRRTCLLGALLGLMASPVHAAQSETIPRIGVDGPELDGCGGIGRVTLFDLSGNQFVSVRREPDQYAREKDRLDPATLVWLCEANGEWQGIVYPTGDFQELGDCKVSTPLAEPEPYSGPCEYGWVHGSSLTLVLQ